MIPRCPLIILKINKYKFQKNDQTYPGISKVIFEIFKTVTNNA